MSATGLDAILKIQFKPTKAGWIRSVIKHCEKHANAVDHSKPV